MMDYLQLRFDIYHHTLTLWLANLKQMTVAIVALFPMAMPALVFTPLVLLAIIVKPNTEFHSYFHTLWGYLLLLYAWLNSQRHGVTGQQHQLYLASLPIPKWQKLSGHLCLLLYVANVFILAPTLLLGYAWFNSSAQDPDLPHVLTSLMGLIALACYYSYVAIWRQTPWLSLLLIPLVLSLSQVSLAKSTLLLAWCAVIAAEWVLSQVPWRGKLPIKGWLQMCVAWEQKHPENNKAVAIFTLLLFLLVQVFSTQVSLANRPYFLSFFAFAIGFVLACNLFSLQKFKQQYQHYLTALPLSAAQVQWRMLQYTGAKLALAFAVLALAQCFDFYQWLILLSVCLFTLIGIINQPQRFALYPFSFASVLVLIAIVMG